MNCLGCEEQCHQCESRLESRRCWPPALFDLSPTHRRAIAYVEAIEGRRRARPEPVIWGNYGDA